MADISFDCPECGGNLSVDEKGAGMAVPCPLCSKRITIPRQSPAEVPPSVRATGHQTKQPGTPDWKSNPVIWKAVGISVAVVICLLWLQRSCRNWQYRRDHQKAMREWNADMQKEFARKEQDEQKRKDAQERAKQAQADRERERQRQAEQKEAAKAEERQQVGKYAAAEFAKFPLTPRLHISPSLGVAAETVEFRGETFDKIRAAYNRKDWLTFYATVMERGDEKPTWPEDNADIDHVLYRIENTKCFLRIAPNTTLTRDNYLLAVSFDRDPQWVEKHEIEWVSGAEYPNHWEKNPSGAGYVCEIRPGKSDMFIIHGTAQQPLHGDMDFLREAHWKALETITKRKELGELTDAAYAAELLRLKDAAMRYCTLLLTPSGMHGQRVLPSGAPGSKRYVSGSLAFFADNPDWGTVDEKMKANEETIRFCTAADIQACLDELDAQIKKYPKYENVRNTFYGLRIKQYLQQAKTREQVAKEGGSLAFLSQCRDSEAALRNVNRLEKIQQAVAERSSSEIQACIDQLNEQLKRCPKVTMPSGMSTYEDSLKGTQTWLYRYLEDAKNRERMAADETQEQKWQAERQAAFSKCLSEAKK